MNNIISCFLRVTKYVALFFLEVTMTVFLSNFTQKQQIVYLPGIKYLCVTDSVTNK